MYIEELILRVNRFSLRYLALKTTMKVMDYVHTYEQRALPSSSFVELVIVPLKMKNFLRNHFDRLILPFIKFIEESSASLNP
jgi:hypothetical protein